MSELFANTLNSEDLLSVNGGTFTPNNYQKFVYHAVGVSTRYHFIEKDEFMFMGKPISYEMANKIVTIYKNISV